MGPTGGPARRRDTAAGRPGQQPPAQHREPQQADQPVDRDEGEHAGRSGRVVHRAEGGRAEQQRQQPGQDADDVIAVHPSGGTARRTGRAEGEPPVRLGGEQGRDQPGRHVGGLCAEAVGQERVRRQLDPAGPAADQGEPDQLTEPTRTGRRPPPPDPRRRPGRARKRGDGHAVTIAGAPQPSPGRAWVLAVRPTGRPVDPVTPEAGCSPGPRRRRSPCGRRPRRRGRRPGPGPGRRHRSAPSATGRWSTPGGRPAGC